MILSSGQKSVLGTLKPIAKIALNKGDLAHLPIQPRTHSLLCGPSGVGKSHLARELAKELNIEALIINCSSWQPNGSRSEIVSFSKIAEFVSKNEKGIIVLDEIDKICGEGEWHGYIRLEIHDLLDGIIPPQVTISSATKEEEEISFWEGEGELTDKNDVKQRTELSKKLKNHFFMIGAGAWQAFWEKEKQAVGFNSDASKQISKPSEQQIRASIYPELLKRFRSEISIIPPMTSQDYRNAANSIAGNLSAMQLQHLRNKFERDLPRAIESQLGMRWLEELTLDALINTQPSIPQLRKPQHLNNIDV